jgi:hypothetical protein
MNNSELSLPDHSWDTPVDGGYDSDVFLLPPQGEVQQVLKWYRGHNLDILPLVVGYQVDTEVLRSYVEIHPLVESLQLPDPAGTIIQAEWQIIQIEDVGIAVRNGVRKVCALQQAMSGVTLDFMKNKHKSVEPVCDEDAWLASVLVHVSVEQFFLDYCWDVSRRFQNAINRPVRIDPINVLAHWSHEKERYIFSVTDIRDILKRGFITS